MRDTSLKVRIALIELILVECVLTMNNLMLIGTFLGSKAEANSENAVGIVWVASARVLVYLWWLVL